MSASSSVIIERTEHPSWLSNAYLIADGSGGHGVLVDGNGEDAPLLARIEAEAIRIDYVLLTHHHGDHVVGAGAHAARFGAPVVAHPLTAAELGMVDQTLGDGEVLRAGDLEIRALHTPGHTAGHLAFLIDGEDCLTGDVLFKGTVGGTRAPGHTTLADLRHSVVERLLSLPPQTRVHPGHSGPTTVGAEWERNPFVRLWRGLERERDEPCSVAGEPATLVLWGPDYDGGHKAQVRFASGEEAVVAGSSVTRRR